MTCRYCGFIPKDQSDYEQHINRFHRGEKIENIFGINIVEKHENGGKRTLETKVGKQVQ